VQIVLFTAPDCLQLCKMLSNALEHQHVSNVQTRTTIHGTSGIEAPHNSCCHAEYDDGTVLFCFGNEPAKETEMDITSDAKLEELTAGMPAASTAQHSEEGQAHSSDKEQDLMAAEEHKADEPGSSSGKLQQTVASQTQQTAASQSEQQQYELSMSSADTSDEEASGSDSGSERLWEMTPQQLEGLKVCFISCFWSIAHWLRAIEECTSCSC